MPLLRRLCLFLPLLLALWHAPLQAKLTFGEVERLQHVANTTLTDPSGAQLYLARKLVEKHFLLPYALEDQGYVLGISGDSRRYYPMPTGDKLAALQQAGHLPTPLPPFELDTLDRVFGHLLWFTLGGLALYGGGHWAWRRWRAARRGPMAIEPSFETAPPRDAPPAFEPPVALPPLPVQLPLRLYPQRLKLLGFLAICTVFVVIGVLMYTTDGLWVGLLCAGFFGLGIPIFIVQMLPGASFLELQADDFTYSALFRKRTVQWRDIADIGVMKIQGRTMVGWNFLPSYAGRSGGHKVSKSISGIEAGLPDSYGMTPTALAELMGLIHLHHLHRLHRQSLQPTPA
ncbi:STM3941 family protein [Piscinibacter sp. HJYY11]|uniref:STM3941 family protein n=1 Tax=Piscinibacter sp. HJYY11 TaxID=2801333 RepID=UPI00191E90D0|nr:STM3941 family protein [Piscinibacter sp. HJYY11]MBL0728395.1 hypothetical protein [Piscinibacter sp. HJYY11]